MKSIKFDSNGRMFEEVTFTNGITDYYYSDELHRVIYQCGCWGLDYNNYNDFNKALQIVRDDK